MRTLRGPRCGASKSRSPSCTTCSGCASSSSRRRVGVCPRRTTGSGRRSCATARWRWCTASTRPFSAGGSRTTWRAQSRTATSPSTPRSGSAAYAPRSRCARPRCTALQSSERRRTGCTSRRSRTDWRTGSPPPSARAAASSRRAPKGAARRARSRRAAKRSRRRRGCRAGRPPRKPRRPRRPRFRARGGGWAPAAAEAEWAAEASRPGRAEPRRAGSVSRAAAAVRRAAVRRARLAVRRARSTAPRQASRSWRTCGGA